MRILPLMWVGGSVAGLWLGVFFAVPWLAQGGFALGLLSLCWHLGRSMAPSAPFWHRLALGLAPSAALLMVATAAVYYTATVSPASLAIAFTASAIVTFLLPPARPSAPSTPHPPSSFFSHLAAWGTLLCIGLFLISATQHATTAASRSPWLELSPLFLVFVGVGIALLLMRSSARTPRASFALAALLLFCTTSLPAFLYPIGYGFDPFLHRATVEHILTNGTITPKAPYYAGQYGLESLLATFTPFTVAALDTWLLPVLASVGIAAWFAFAWPQVSGAWLLALPLAPFVSTTPFGLAILLWLLTLAASRTSAPRWVGFLFAAGALALHPLVGLPALWWVLASTVTEHPRFARFSSWKHRVGAYAIIVAIGSLLLPAAFALFSGGMDAHLPRLAALFATAPNTMGAPFGDAAALGIWLMPALLIALALGYAWRHRHDAWVHHQLIASLLFLGNLFLLASTQTFAFVISYEQDAYLARLLALALLSLCPMAIAGAQEAWRAFHALPLARTVRAAGLISVSFLLSANVYGAFPRHDGYRESRGFTVGEVDRQTVLAIAQHAGSTPYIVLANQSVSAAAVEAFGFQPFYGVKGDVYFYPIPTSGPAYAHFLTMIEKGASLGEAQAAMELAGVPRLYFVVNDYWWSAALARESARETAGDWFSIGGNTVFVYSAP